MKHKISDLDFVFLSFDEPNAEELYAEVLDMVPWCKRVHGVKGFDAAHRACADAADTKFFVTVDGDNRIYPEFLDLELDIAEDQHDHAWTWSGRNHVNGLVYGNGGLKLWSKAFVYGMNSHENASDATKTVDFCWDTKYHDLFGCYSTSVINSTPQQAWRSGFREGVKMSLDQGRRISPVEFNSKIWFGNISRLCIWSSVGQDVENGIWAIYGARMGCHLATLSDADHQVISNYDAMEAIWRTIADNDPYQGSVEIGNDLKVKLGLDITLLSSDDSRFFKRAYMNIPRPIMPIEKISHFMAYKNV
jgi:hypothetical protein